MSRFNPPKTFRLFLHHTGEIIVILCVMLSLTFSSTASAAGEPIGIIGAGTVGTTLARLWIKSGHPVMISSRNPDSIRSEATQIGAKAGSPQQAALFGQVIVTAVPFGALPAVGKEVGSLIKNKVVLDPSNPYPGRDGALARHALGTSSGQVSAKALHNSHVVRAFNVLAMETLSSEAGHGIGIPIASDDPHALKVASQLVRDAGFVPVVAGGLSKSHRFDPGSNLFLNPQSASQLESALHTN
ncbi:F420 [Halomonadaceae bacterium LMG 33818]|uniref:NADPH-dependent F420 reductase n=1 Tax=Cernens ardua TaxID=3402176 RepID=UPI003EDCA1D2